MDNELPHTNTSTLSHTSLHFSKLLKVSLLLGSSGLLSACAAFFSDQYVDQALPEPTSDVAELSQESKQKPGPIVSPAIEAPAPTIVKSEPVKHDNAPDFHKPVAPSESAESAGGNKALQAIQAITRSTQISQVGMVDRKISSSSEPVNSFTSAPAIVTPTLQAPVKTVPEVAVSNIQHAAKAVVEGEPAVATKKPIATKAASSSKSPQPSSPTVLVSQTTSDHPPVKQAKKPNRHTEPEIAEVNALTEQAPTAAGITPQSLSPAPKQPVTAVASARKVTSNMLDNMQKEFGMWEVLPNHDNDHQGQCKISSSTVQLHNNGYSAQLWIDIVDDQLIVNSTANIDIKRNTVGLRFDQGELLPFERKQFSNAAIKQGNLSELLRNSDTLHIYLGGDEFGKQSHYARIDLSDLKSAYNWFNKCR